jgi:NTP pyrophosphatase (non-canonical NTP hydrolase)
MVPDPDATTGDLGAIPTVEDSSSPRPAVLRFARLMEAQLREHDDRPGWQDCTLDWLYGRMVEEAEELREAIERAPGQRRGSVSDDWREDYQRAREEAADVANFAMMIADVLGSPTAGEADAILRAAGEDPDGQAGEGSS